MKYNSGGLINSLMILSIAGFMVLTFTLLAVFTNAFYENLDNFSSSLEIRYSKNAKIEAKDKVDKVVDFIGIYEKILQNDTKQTVKDNVEFAYNVISEVDKQYWDLPVSITYQKIKDKLGNSRFFDDKSGYFFIYDMKGNCILSPIAPKSEGKNQINLQDSNKKYIIRRMIKIVKTQNEGFLSWFWCRPGEKIMKEKLGYVKLYKPLGIFVGTARYKEDILDEIKQNVTLYLKNLDKDEYGYIFAYDFSENSMLESSKYKKINRWDDAANGYHLVRYAIKGAQRDSNGFFLHYNLKSGEEKLSYIKSIPNFNWIIGTNIQNIKAVYTKEKESLQKSMSVTLKNSILISIAILALFVLVFLLISFKIKKLFKELGDAIKDRTKELIEQKNVFKKIFDTAPDGIALSKDKRFYDCNGAVLRIFEAKSKEEFLQLENKDYFPLEQEDGSNSMVFLESKLDIGKQKGSVDFEIEAKTINGRKIWLNVVITKIILHGEEAGYFVLRDMTDKKRIEKDLQIQQQKLIFQAKHDSLTSLPNRLFLADRLSQSINRAKRKERYLAVAFLDIDNFKMVNDAFGHNMGDLLLIEIASVLKSLIRVTDIVSRVSGDEFVLVMDDLASINDSSTIIQKIIDRFQEPFYIENLPFSITFSIGISVYPNDSDDEQNLLKFADMAMYRAKNCGKNRYLYYDESMNSDVLKHMEIEQEIKRGIKNDEFVLHYQPQFEVGSKKIVGFEALVRWQHPKLGLKFPDYFIEIAENSRAIVALGEVISKKAMKQVSLWHDKGLKPGTMSINFTSKQLQDRDFFDRLGKLLKESGCKAEWIEAELIERYVMRDTQETSNLLKCFKDMGVQVAIDDFGTGYSSLGYLKYLEISKLKIDKVFIDDLQSNKKDRAIAKSIIDLSVGMDLKVIAEGVENAEQYEILEKLGCQIIQGYYFSKPISADEAESLLREKREEKQPLPR